MYDYNIVINSKHAFTVFHSENEQRREMLCLIPNQMMLVIQFHYFKEKKNVEQKVILIIMDNKCVIYQKINAWEVTYFQIVSNNSFIL